MAWTGARTGSAGLAAAVGYRPTARQAEVLAWPGVARVGQTTPQELSTLLRWCLTAEARARAGTAADQSRPALDDIRARFLALFSEPLGP